MTTLWHAVVASLLMAWICTAFAWACAGVAIASWGRLPLWLGAVLSGLFPVVGAGVMAGLVLLRGPGRRAGLLPEPVSSTSDHSDAGDRGFGFASDALPSGFGTGALSQPIPSSEFGSSAFASTGSGYQDDEWSRAVSMPAQLDPTPARFDPSSVPAAVNSGRRQWTEAFFCGTAALIAVVLVASLLISTWVRVAATRNESFSLGAWDLGLGTLIVVTVCEFAVLAASTLWWRSRWVGVLAVFAGSWWLLMFWVAEQVSGGLSHLAHGIRVKNAPVGTSFHAGAVWLLIALLGLGMTMWGLVQLTHVHLVGPGHRRAGLRRGSSQ